MGLMERIKLWFRGFNYKEISQIVKELQKNPAIGDAAFNVFLGSLMMGAVVFISMALVGSMPGAGSAGAVVFIPAIIYAVAMILIAIIYFFVSEGVQWVLAKALGGKGAYAHQVQVSSLPTAANMVLTPVFVIPFVGPIISIVVSLYRIFLGYLIIRGVHGLSNVRAAAVVLIPVVLGIIAYVLLLLYLTPMAVTTTTPA